MPLWYKAPLLPRSPFPGGFALKLLLAFRVGAAREIRACSSLQTFASLEELHDVRVGVMTSDPRKVARAVPIPLLTFEEATELAYFGAAVLHPLAMQPALQNGNLNVRVKNSYNRYARSAAYIYRYALLMYHTVWHILGD